MKTVYKTSLSPKKGKGLHTRKTNIQENSLTTKKTFHQKAFSMKTFYKTSPSPKNILHENGLQNKPFTKERSPRNRSTKQTVQQKKIQRNGLQNKPSIKKNSRKRSTKKALATNVPQENAQHKGLGHKKCGRSNHISDM